MTGCVNGWRNEADSRGIRSLFLLSPLIPCYPNSHRSSVTTGSSRNIFHICLIPPTCLPVQLQAIPFFVVALNRVLWSSGAQGKRSSGINIVRVGGLIPTGANHTENVGSGFILEGLNSLWKLHCYGMLRLCGERESAAGNSVWEHVLWATCELIRWNTSWHLNIKIIQFWLLDTISWNRNLNSLTVVSFFLYKTLQIKAQPCFYSNLLNCLFILSTSFTRGRVSQQDQRL